MALGIRDYYLFISYLDFKACAEQSLSHICVCIISMPGAKVSSCGCQGFTQTLLLFSPHDLCTQRSSAPSSLLPFFQLSLARLFPRKPPPLPSPKLFQPLHHASALPPPQGCASSLPMLPQPPHGASSCSTCPPQGNGHLAGSSSAGGALLQGFLGNSPPYVGNC